MLFRELLFSSFFHQTRRNHNDCILGKTRSTESKVGFKVVKKKSRGRTIFTSPRLECPITTLKSKSYSSPLTKSRWWLSKEFWFLPRMFRKMIQFDMHIFPMVLLNQLDMVLRKGCSFVSQLHLTQKNTLLFTAFACRVFRTEPPQKSISCLDVPGS